MVKRAVVFGKTSRCFMMKVKTSWGILFSTDEDYNFPLFYHSSFSPILQY